MKYDYKDLLIEEYRMEGAEMARQVVIWEYEALFDEALFERLVPASRAAETDYDHYNDHFH
jgi:hypothetical protein